MNRKDYYEVLGVPKGSDADTIKKAFRKLAKKYHPDQNQGNKSVEQKFKEVNEAYEVLKDSDKRAAYDRYGHSAFDQTMGGGAPGNGARAGDFSDFSDVFSSFFNDIAGGHGGSARQNTSPSRRGSDLSHELFITLDEAFFGKKQTIRYGTLLKCEKCGGSGSASGSGTVRCAVCNGSGRVRTQQGFFMIEQVCGKCRGSGTIIKDPCTSCNGEGRVTKNRVTEIAVPSGINNGDRLRIAGAGEAGVCGGESGDLYIIVHIKDHKFYKRQGDNLRCSIPIKMVTAAIGGAVEIPSMDGKSIKITIPHGTQNGTELRVRGKGMPVYNSQNSFGDLFVKISVETPTNLSKQQKDILTQFDDNADEKTSPETHSFFKKIKDFFK